MIVAAALVGYFLGSLPTAIGLARLWGVDLRSTGSGNPGANNARRAGGLVLATIVLLVEISKGLLAVVVGLAMAEEAGAVLAGIGAAAGNVFNPWYQFGGGKGLGISTGVVLGIWPTAFPALLVVIILAALISRSSGMASLSTFGMMLILSFVWPAADLEMAWGIAEPAVLPLLAGGLVLVLVRKHLRDARPSSDNPPLSDIDDNRDWPVVQQTHFHHCTKRSGLHGDSKGPDLLHEQIEQRLGHVRVGCSHK